MEKILIYIKEKINLKDIARHFNVKNLLVIHNLNNVPLFLKDIPCKHVDAYQISPTINKDTLLWLQNWANKKVINGKSFKDFLKFENSSLYYLMESGLYRNSFKNCYSIRDVLISLESVLNILKQERPSFVLVMDDGDLISKAFVMVCKSKGIPFKVKKQNNQHFPKFLFYKLSLFLKLKEKVRKFLSLLDGPSYKYMNHPVLFLTSTQSLYQKTKPYDKILSPIITDLNKCDHYLLEVEYISKFNLKKLLYRLINKKPNQNLIEYFLTPTIFRKLRLYKKQLKQKWYWIKDNDSFKNSFNYKEVLFWDVIKNQFDLFFNVLLIELAKQPLHMLEILRKVKPSLVVMVDEGSVFGRAMSVVAKENKVPTLAIQHGIIHPSHPSYIIPSDYPRPSLTCVNGVYDKKVLTKISSFKNKEVVITGQSHYDVMKNFNLNTLKPKLCKKFGINPDKKIILWATQSHGLSLKENMKTVSAVYNAVRASKDVQLVVKLHPQEDQKASLYKGNKGYFPIIIKGEESILPLIFICDLIITKNSTSAIEASLMDKPVLVLNLGGQKDVMDFVEKGIALGVYKDEDLAQSIKKILLSSKIRERLRKKRSKYNLEHNYLNDSKATERITNIINTF
ncbi:CDP-glycerol glycerophosphotransferase family protein [Nanoarchaeota archaeon]